MKSGKLYTGIVLEADSLKFAVIQIKDKKVQLVRVDRFSLLEKLDKPAEEKEINDVFGESSDDIFDLDSALSDDDSSSEIELDDDILSGIDDDILGDLDDDILGEIGDDLDLELDELEKGDEIVDVDMVDETEGPISNEIQVFNFLSNIDPKRVDLGLNIPAGTAIFQVLKDVNFNEVKNKDLKVIIDDRL